MKYLVSTLAFILLVVFAIWIGGMSVEYLAEFWGTIITGNPVDVPFFPCAVAGLFLSQFSIPLAILTWVLSFII